LGNEITKNNKIKQIKTSDRIERGLKTMKKFLAGLLALTMLLSMGAVALAEGTAEEFNQGPIVGDGSTAYIDLIKYNVVLPTTNTLDFQLDPQGLLAIPKSGKLELGALNGGTIVPSGVASVINQSTEAVKVTVALQGTGDATFIEYDEDDETTIGAVEEGTDNNVLLYAMPSSVDTRGTGTAYSASTQGYVITKDSPITLTFALGAAQYNVTNTSGKYALALTANTGHGTGIRLGGYVNDKANWSGYLATAEVQQKVGVQATFTFTDASDEDLDDLEDPEESVEGIPGLLKPAAEALTFEVLGFIGRAKDTELTGNHKLVLDNPSTFTLPFNLLGKSVTKIVVGSTALTVDTHYTTLDNRISFVPGYITTASWAKATDGLACKITVDGITYTLTLTITDTAA
jgi:hypothetical protein